MDVCFITRGGRTAFLDARVPAVPGRVVDTVGRGGRCARRRARVHDRTAARTRGRGRRRAGTWSTSTPRPRPSPSGDVEELARGHVDVEAVTYTDTIVAVGARVEVQVRAHGPSRGRAPGAATASSGTYRSRGSRRARPSRSTPATACSAPASPPDQNSGSGSRAGCLGTRGVSRAGRAAVARRPVRAGADAATGATRIRPACARTPLPRTRRKRSASSVSNRAHDPKAAPSRRSNASAGGPATRVGRAETHHALAHEEDRIGQRQRIGDRRSPPGRGPPTGVRAGGRGARRGRPPATRSPAPRRRRSNVARRAASGPPRHRHRPRPPRSAAPRRRAPGGTFSGKRSSSPYAAPCAHARANSPRTASAHAPAVIDQREHP